MSSSPCPNTSPHPTLEGAGEPRRDRRGIRDLGLEDDMGDDERHSGHEVDEAGVATNEMGEPVEEVEGPIVGVDPDLDPGEGAEGTPTGNVEE